MKALTIADIARRNLKNPWNLLQEGVFHEMIHDIHRTIDTSIINIDAIKINAGHVAQNKKHRT